MKKLIKILAGIVIALVVLVLVVVLTLPLTINPIVKTAASVGGPKVLGVPVSVGNVSLSPLSGSMTISQLVVGNPEGYSDRPAFAVDKVEVGLKIRSLFGDTIVVEKIQVDSPAISFESKNGVSNFDAIQANAKKASGEEQAKAAEEEKGKKPGKKVVIETFSLSGAHVSCTAAWTFGKPITLPLPPVTMHDIGKDSGGTSPAEAVSKVINEVVGSLSKAVSAMANQAGDLLKGTLKGGGDAAKGATEALKDVAGGAGDAVKDAAKGLKNLFK